MARSRKPRAPIPISALRLPVLLREAGLRDVAMTVVQPAGTDEAVKLINPITMESIGEAVVASGLASPREVDRLVADLYAAARDDRTVLSMPRIVQTWGRKARPRSPAPRPATVRRGGLPNNPCSAGLCAVKAPLGPGH